MKVEIIANFLVWEPGEGDSERRVEFTKGMVVDKAPDGQSLQDWVDKGLAKAVSTAGAGDEPAHEAGGIV